MSLCFSSGCESNVETQGTSENNVNYSTELGDSGEVQRCTDGEVQLGITPCGLNREGFLNQTCSDGKWVDNEGICTGTHECTNGTSRRGTTACGLNDEGFLSQDCIGGMWSDNARCSGMNVCVNGANQIGTSPCGFNLEGFLNQECIDGGWIDNPEACTGTHECVNGSAQVGTTMCGFNGEGALNQDCIVGTWVDTSRCADPDVCINGATQAGSTICGFNGEGVFNQTCTGGTWVDNNTCTGTDVCVNDSVQMGSTVCGLNDEGVSNQSCINGAWADNNTCTGTDICINDSVQPGGTVCGINREGVLNQRCINGVWVDNTRSCTGTDVCRNDMAQAGITSCGLNDEGVFNQDCINGAWIDNNTCTGTHICVNSSTQFTGVPCGEDGTGQLEDICVNGRWRLSDLCSLCEVNERVDANQCVPCPPGHLRPAGDDRAGNDTVCMDPTLILTLNGLDDYADSLTVGLTQINRLIYIDPNTGHRYLNTRWPIEGIRAAFNLQAALVQNDVNPITWQNKGLSTLRNESLADRWTYTFVDWNGDTETDTLFNLFEQVLSQTPPLYEIFWLGLDSIVFRPDRSQTERFGEPYSQYYFNNAIGFNLNRGNNFTSNLSGLTEYRAYLFNLLQSAALLSSGTLDESLVDYAQLDPPAVMNPKVTVTSNDSFLEHFVITAVNQGSAETMWPWGVRIDHSDGNSVSFSAEELNTQDSSVTLTPEQVDLMNPGKNTVYLVPENGSELTRFGERVHFIFAKAQDRIIDFNESDDFSGEVTFAETFGDIRGIRYYFTKPIHIRAQPGYGIVVRSTANGGTYRTGEEEITNLNVFLKNTDLGSGRGWHDLWYLHSGVVNGDRVLYTGNWDHEHRKFIVYQEEL